MKKGLLILIILSLAQVIYAQQKSESEIFVKATCPSASLFGYTFTITRTPKTITIFYERGDSLNFAKMKKIEYGNNLSQRYYALNTKKNLSKADSLIRDSVMIFRKKVDSAIKAVLYYTRDTIILKRKSDYNSLFETVMNTSTAVLMKENPERRKYLDGIFYEIALKNNGKIRNITAETPDDTSQPLLAKFMDATMAIITAHKKTGKL